MGDDEPSLTGTIVTLAIPDSSAPTFAISFPLGLTFADIKSGVRQSFSLVISAYPFFAPVIAGKLQEDF